MQLVVLTVSNHNQPAAPATPTPPFLGRLELCFDGISSLFDGHLKKNTHFPSPIPSPPQAVKTETQCQDFRGLRGSFALTERRTLIARLFAYLGFHPSRYLSAYGLGDPSVTVELVTPSAFPSEERIAQLFEKNTYSVFNIIDVTLHPQLNVTGVVEFPEGNGSGVVWDRQGHIVTNYHVIGNSLSRNPSRGQVVARVNILASEGGEKNFEGRLVGADRTKDLAVLKVEAPQDLLRPITIGPSYSLRVGQKCLAIGNPFGFDHTLAVGVSGGLNRDIFRETGVTIGGGIQTDAAINPGNSGGPLLDSKGNLIGINMPILTQTGVDSLAAKVGLVPTSRGFAGNIVLGDIIVAVDKKPVRSRSECNIEDEVLLQIRKGSETLELPIVL